MTDHEIESIRVLWREDLAAMAAGTYKAPLPHPAMIEKEDE